MSIAIWCVLVAAVLPYVWTTIAKGSGERRYDNRDPRGWLARQQNPISIRANAAHLNAFEAFAPFAAGISMAAITGVDRTLVTLLALAFVAFRVLHGIFYLTGWHYLRSAAWLGGFACVVVLMVNAARAAAA